MTRRWIQWSNSPRVYRRDADGAEVRKREDGWFGYGRMDIVGTGAPVVVGHRTAAEAMAKLDAVLPPGTRPRTRQLRKIAAYINAQTHLGLRAETASERVNTDRPKPSGLRYRTHVGKGRNGIRLRVWFNGTLVLDHNSGETYRTNGEVEEWLAEWESGQRRNRILGTSIA